MERPSIFWHMIRWGFLSGTILAVLYSAAFRNDVFEAIDILTDPFTWYFSMWFGGIQGVILGLVDAIALKFLVRRFPRPFTNDAMKSSRFKVYTLVFILTLIVAFIPIVLMWLAINYQGGNIVSNLWFELPPPFIAATAAVYATHRYLFQLRRWDERADDEQRLAMPKQDTNHLVDDLNELEAYIAAKNTRQMDEQN